MRFLTEQSRGSFLPLSTPVGESTVFDELIRKHPDPSPVTPTSLVTSDTTSFHICHPIIFDCLNGDLIRRTAIRVEGSAGPSGVDALGWRRLCTSFRTASSDLCHSLASVARRISTSFIDPDTLQPLLNCRLIALDKNPGVRPIGIGETSRRIIAKAVLQVVKQDILDAAGCLQLCAGQRAGCEAAVHAMREIFADQDTEGVLLVDASNAFNSLNRHAALLNMFQLCPPLATILTNTYRSPSHLFIDGTSLLSREGTTQGDPLAMPMYAISVVPVIRQLMGMARQVWYADDAAAGGSLLQLKDWWSGLLSFSRHFGYHVNAAKTWLVVKEEYLASAQRIFDGSGIQITSAGRPYLGAAIDSQDYIRDYTRDHVSQWAHGLSQLSLIAATQPHAAYTVLTHGFSSKWKYFLRTNPHIGDLLSPLELGIRQHFLPTLIPHPPSDLERELFGLPVSLGGLGICDPCRISTDDYNFSLELSRPLVDLILHQHGSLPHDVIDSQYIILKQLSQVKYQSQIDAIQSVLTRSSSTLRQTIEHCQDKGVSSWLSVIPIEQYGFALHKNEFTDALCLRYGWTPPHLPSHCVCGKAFSVTHAFSCPHGAFPIIRHNYVRDLTAKLLSEVCHDVQTEPHLQPLTGEILRYKTAVHEDDARVDIRAAGFWGCRHHRSFFDVRVFNAFAESNQSTSLAATFRKHEGEKRRAYEERVREVERGSFTPLVFSSLGGMGKAATVMYRRLANLLSVKWNSSYSLIMGWLRCSLSFSLLRSSLMCLRGSRSSSGSPGVPAAVDLVVAEGRLATSSEQ